MLCGMNKKNNIILCFWCYELECLFSAYYSEFVHLYQTNLKLVHVVGSKPASFQSYRVGIFAKNIMKQHKYPLAYHAIQSSKDARGSILYVKNINTCELKYSNRTSKHKRKCFLKKIISICIKNQRW